MHIQRIRARHFKRFHDLTLEVVGTPQLVVLCGPNGRGKSSLIDAIDTWYGNNTGMGASGDADYMNKSGEATLTNNIEVDFVEPLSTGATDRRRLIYARSAYRHEADFSMSSISRMGDLFQAPRSTRMIDPETKVSNNYQRIVARTVGDVFSGERDSSTVGALRDEYIGRVRDAMLSLFPDLELQGPGDPMAEGTFFFKKNGKPQFHYKNLSGGEKAAFDLILDMVIKIAVYNDTVFIIDEPELHLSTRLQSQLLDVLLGLIPSTSQLWIATHSIGMMRKSQELYASDSKSVAYLDFDGHDFDEPAVIMPTSPSRDFWTNQLSVALGDLAELVAPDRVVLCEGRPATSNAARAEFDARCYRTIFATDFPRTDFVSVGNAHEVAQDRVELGRTIETIITGTKVIRVVDRDGRTDQEIEDAKKQGYRVLRRRHLEAYLLDREVLKALCSSVGREDDLPQVEAAMAKVLADSVAKGNDPDNMKEISGEFFVAARQLLALTNAGHTKEAFLADTLAPLITPDMAVYAELREDVLG